MNAGAWREAVLSNATGGHRDIYLSTWTVEVLFVTSEVVMVA
jgi:hypothetical protein